MEVCTHRLTAWRWCLFRPVCQSVSLRCSAEFNPGIISPVRITGPRNRSKATFSLSLLFARPPVVATESSKDGGVLPTRAKSSSGCLKLSLGNKRLRRKQWPAPRLQRKTVKPASRRIISFAMAKTGVFPTRKPVISTC